MNYRPETVYAVERRRGTGIQEPCLTLPMTNSVTKPASSARRWRRRLRALSCIAAALAVSPLAAAGAQAAVRPAAAASLPIWSGYVNSTDGVRLWANSVGGGAPNAKVVVLVHGGPGLSLTYLRIFDLLASPTRQIVSYDQRGSGRSTAPADGDYGIEAQVSDLDSVRTWTGARQITVIGHSWGGIWRPPIPRCTPPMSPRSR